MSLVNVFLENSSNEKLLQMVQKGSKSCKKIKKDFLNLEDGTDAPSRNLGEGLLFDAV
jgi:hypothetical protein